MNYMSIEGLTKSYGERVLFEKINFGVSQGQKVALIAANGAGKSTLLKIIKGKEIPDEGKVIFRNDISIGFLDQNPELNLESEVLEELFQSNNPMMLAVREYEDCLESPGEDEAYQIRLHDSIEKMEALNAWDYEARTTKSKSRIDSFYDVEAKANQNKKEEKVNLGVNMTRLGNKILDLDNVSKFFGEMAMLRKFSYTFRRKERIGIVGPNGVGKSTFLNLLMGLLNPDMGVIETGETIVFGYYNQEGLVLKEDKRIIEVVKDIAEFIPVGNGQMMSASQFLQHFMFSPQKQYTFVSKLSGGELRRLHLLTILMKNPNFLILDEPTNDLDLITLGLLEEFLMSFGGCLIVVTHDRYFMDRLVDHLFVFEGDGIIKDFNGSYSEYKSWKQDKERQEKLDQKPEKVNTLVAVEKETTAPVKKLSYKEQREYELLENEIALLEDKKTQLETELNSGISDHTALNNLAQQIQTLIAEIDNKTIRWLQFGERV
jgi:ATP-binding cassette subfamily F protein uup